MYVTKEKQTHRLPEQTSGYQWEEMGVRDQETQTTEYKIAKMRASEEPQGVEGTQPCQESRCGRCRPAGLLCLRLEDQAESAASTGDMWMLSASQEEFLQQQKKGLIYLERPHQVPEE